MRHIAHLDLRSNGSLRGDRWRSLSVDLGVPLQDYAGSVGDSASLLSFIRGATGLILPNRCFLTSQLLVDAIHECVADGMRLFVPIDANELDPLNSFLQRYGIEGTHLKIYAERFTDHPRLLRLDRKQSADSFRPHFLLDGVDSLTIEQADAIRYGSTVVPVLTVPLERVKLVDRMSDYEASWRAPEISCIVLSPVSGSGGVLASSTQFTTDPYRAASGVTFPGIAADQNEKLARNILTWLSGATHDVETIPVQAFNLVDQIERGLVEFVVSTLMTKHSDWWTEAIPMSVRIECAKRCEEEGNKLPKPAYLDLVHIKEILEKNWTIFEAALSAVGWSGGKKRALSWLVTFNETRRSVMHPTRRSFAPQIVSDKTVSALRVLLERVRALRISTSAVH